MSSTHWNEHKLECKKLGEKREEVIEWKGLGGCDDDSWKKLSRPMKKKLRELHAMSGVTDTWKITHENEELIVWSNFPSFLTAHPAMTFKIKRYELPSGEMRCVDYRYFHPKGNFMTIIEETIRRNSRSLCHFHFT
jgi:hypothetical protein